MTEEYSEETGKRDSATYRERERGETREREGVQGDLVGSICLCLSSSGRDVRNMQGRAVIIICAPHRRRPPCALEDGDAPRGAARSAEPVVSETPAKPTTYS